MDPVSLTGLAVSVMDVSKVIYDYITAVKEAKEDIRRLGQEMFALKGTLDHMTAFNARSQGRRAEEMEGVVKMTLEVLETIKKRLEKRTSGIGKSIQVLTWPFHKTDIDRFVATIERAKTWFIMTLLQDTTEQTSAVFSEVQRLATIIHEDILARQLDRMTQDMEEMISCLSPVNPGEDHIRVRHDLVPGTGGWFMDKSFEEWVEVLSDCRPMLWVNGKSGAGKSSLFSNVVEELTQRISSQSHQSICCFFYCRSGNTASQDPVNIFGSLLAQLYRSRPELGSQIQPLLTPDNSLIPRSSLSLPDLLRLLTHGLSLIDRCFLLVDALNETPHNRQVASLLAKLCETCPNLRVLVTSTSEPHVKGRQLLIKLMSPKAVDHDIGVYVSHRLQTEACFSSLSERIKTEIQLTMATCSHGMFRWAQLGLDRLSRHRTGRDVLLTIKDLPSTLHETYAMLLGRIPQHDRQLAINAFTWLSFSFLSLRQLAEAVVLEETDRDLDDDLRLTDPNIIVEICGGLIQLEDRRVTLAHDSFRSFLLSDWIRTSSVSQFALDAATANRTMMRKCLAYFLFDEFATGFLDRMADLSQRKQRYPLIEYAATNWPNHAGNTVLERRDEELILRFFATKSNPRGGSFDSWVQVLLGTVRPLSIQQTEPLYYAASYNMVPVVRLLLRPGSNIDVNKPGGRFGSSPLAIACFRGHSEVAMMLLEAGADPNVFDSGTRRTALNMAKYKGMKDVAQMIVNHPKFKLSKSDKPAVMEGVQRDLVLPWWEDGEETSST